MIRINLDVMLAKRKMSLTELAEKVGITLANLRAQDRQGQGRALFDSGRALPRARLPAGGHTRIHGGRQRWMSVS